MPHILGVASPPARTTPAPHVIACQGRRVASPAPFVVRAVPPFLGNGQTLSDPLWQPFHLQQWFAIALHMRQWPVWPPFLLPPLTKWTCAGTRVADANL